MLSNENLTEFTNQVASDSPAPGGGSVAALSGSLSAGLLVMFCQLTVGKEKFSHVEAEVKQVCEEAEELKDFFLKAIDRDTEAFNEVMKAFKLPKNTEKEKQERKEAIQAGFKEAASVPFEMAESSLKVMEKARDVVAKGNPNAITDLGVCADMALSAFRGAKKNVRINLGSIKDEGFVKEHEEKLEELEREIEVLYEEINDKVESEL